MYPDRARASLNGIAHSLAPTGEDKSPTHFSHDDGQTFGKGDTVHVVPKGDVRATGHGFGITSVRSTTPKVRAARRTTSLLPQRDLVAAHTLVREVRGGLFTGRRGSAVPAF